MTGGVAGPTPPIVRGAVGGRDVEWVRTWAAEVEAWPVGSHAWGHYAERTDGGDVVCRTENVSACHPAFAALVRGVLADVAASAIATEVADFKDKLNYKHPGGAGFSPHQDLPAYPGVESVVSVLLAIDECTTASGCLWLAPEVDRLLPTDERGVVRAEVASGLRWTPAELAPGDAVVIDGLAPHYSEANMSSRSRRVFVASYAPRRERYGRDAYYGERAEVLAALAGEGPVRISTLGDFEGTVLTEPAGGVDDGGGEPAGVRCTHPGPPFLGDFTAST